MARAMVALPCLLLAAACALGCTGPAGLVAGDTYAVGDAPVSIRAADLNGDHAPDLVVVNRASNDVSVLLNEGDAAFAGAATYPVGERPTSVEVVDLDGDGDPDLLVANSSAGTLSELFNQGDGTFADAVEVYASGTISSPISIAAADLNGDGEPDRVTALSLLLGSGAVGVGLSTSFGTFTEQKYFLKDYPGPSWDNQGVQPTALALSDLDGDGAPDFVVAGAAPHDVEHPLEVWLNDGTGAFSQASTYMEYSRGVYSIAVGDLDGDGLPDLSLFISDDLGALTGVEVLFNQGAGAFAEASVYLSEDLGQQIVKSEALGDFDGDGELDIAVVGVAVEVLRNQGGGAFHVVGHSALPPELGACAIAAADLNGDGLTDLAAAGSQVVILINQGF